MYTCEYSTRIWHSIKREMEKYDIEIEINCKNIMYNLVHLRRNFLPNFLVLYAKFYIFRCKCANTKPNVQELFKEFEEMYYIEYMNALYKQKLSKHYDKWSPILHYQRQH